MTRSQYRRGYLRSAHWKATAHEARLRAGNRCQVCGCTNRPLDVHHRTYEHLGHELPGDLIVCCRACHKSLERGKVARRVGLRVARYALRRLLWVVAFSVVVGFIAYVTAPVKPGWRCGSRWHPAVYCAPHYRGPGG